MHYDMKECGKRIRQLRMKKGYTQEEVAQTLNVDRSFYGRIESGQKGCSVDILVRLSDFFNVSLDYLILGKEQDFSLQFNMQENLKADIVELISHLETLASKL